MRNKLFTMILLILAFLTIFITACASPKFELTNMTITPDPVGAGDEITVTVDVANIGKASGNYTAILKIDEEVTQETIVSVDPGVSKKVNFDIVIKEVGYYSVTIEDLTSTLDVKKPAELVLETPVISPTEVLPGETATIRLNGRNIGEVTGIFDIDLSANGEVIQTKEVTIDSGETIAINFELILNIPGQYDIGIGDHHLDLKVLKPAEFQISGLKISPEEPVTNQDIFVSTELSNLGEVTGIHTVSFSVDGKIIESREVEVYGGDTVSVNFRFMEHLGGNYDVIINNRKVTLPIYGPTYGGSLRLLTHNINTFDDVINLFPASASTMQLTNEELVIGDWTRGPAGSYGTGETTWRTIYFQDYLKDKDLKSGCVAESWEITNSGEIVFHIRKGIHYALDKDNEASNLVNGRELTAEDVAFSLRRSISKHTSYFYTEFSQLKYTIIDTPDDWTVVISVPGNLTQEAFTLFGDFVRIVPPEVVERYGDMNDWRNSVGTGPFILKEFITNQVATFEKNYKYWMNDPIGPGVGNQLPYVEEVKLIIVSDTSTRLAAFRVGKVDQISLVKEEDLASVTLNNQMSALIKNDYYETPRYYICWQPWLKNYSGEYLVGYYNEIWPQYVWLDLDLKEELTGRR
ncbi:MAG TPA: hypothetical protein G4O15_06225 [Dehalococcoidia bacterium]|nr:hypothetical protein [Dehalococcoidia bacterium]